MRGDPNSPTKACRKCGDTKPRSDFPADKKSRDGLHSYCRACNYKRKLTADDAREAARARLEEEERTQTKRCTACKETKPWTEFHHMSGGKHGLLGKCKACQTAYAAEYRSAHPELSESDRARYEGVRRSPDKYERLKKQQRDRKYGISFDALWDEQGGLCAACHKPMRYDGQKGNSAFVDHDHACCPKWSCGKCVRGLVHRTCNLIMGWAHDDPSLLEELASFVRRSSKELIEDGITRSAKQHLAVGPAKGKP